MKIGLTLLCAGTVVFMLRILVAFLAETKNRPNLPMKIHMTKFNPKFKPWIQNGDLINMKSNEDIQKTATRKAAGAAFLLTAVLLLALPAHAQQTSDSSSSNAGAAANQPSTTDQELVKELDAMKKRIEQLEAQLANKKSQEQPSSDAQVPTKADDSRPVTATAKTEAAPSAETKPGKEEPFAFADWTWLNGNSRTKTLAFDSKFFTPEIRADIDYKSPLGSGEGNLLRRDVIMVPKSSVDNPAFQPILTLAKLGFPPDLYEFFMNFLRKP
jgi:hypothetical protein